MHYREIQPSAAAAKFVRCYWTLEDDGLAGLQRIVPDGRPELILNLGQPYESQNGSGWTPQPQCFVMGQITGPLVLRASGHAKMLGIRFHPHTACQVLKIPMCELTDARRPTSVDDISRPLFQELQRLRELRAPHDWFPALDRIIGERAGRVDGLLSLAVRELELAGGLMGIQEVAGHAGLSTRQFERRFRSAAGIAPKLFCRMQRFQRVFRALEHTHSSWADAAVQCGYYDQAHLIRDFREFAGKPPAALLANETDLARHFVQSKPMSRFSKT